MDTQKRALAIEDISCVGRCSLTVALPILSAAGLDSSILPTAVLSTHTGGFTGFTFRDLTEDIEPIAAHWRTLNLRFDAIKTGYLGSFAQIELVRSLFESFKGKDTVVLIDPVMADNGRLYPSFPETFPQGMRKLVPYADVLVPNLTEAALLLGEDYNPGPYAPEYIEGLCRRLSALGAPKVVLTGVTFDPALLGAASFDAATGRFEYAFRPKIEGYFHGTGDVFACALLAALLSGKGLGQAAEIAVDFTQNSIELTEQAGQEKRYGVCFERALPRLMRLLGVEEQ